MKIYQVLTKIDKYLSELLEFNKAIVQFDAVLTSMDSWINGKGQVWKMHRPRSIIDLFFFNLTVCRRNWLL